MTNRLGGAAALACGGIALWAGLALAVVIPDRVLTLDAPAGSTNRISLGVSVDASVDLCDGSASAISNASGHIDKDLDFPNFLYSSTDYGAGTFSASSAASSTNVGLSAVNLSYSNGFIITCGMPATSSNLQFTMTGLAPSIGLTLNDEAEVDLTGVRVSLNQGTISYEGTGLGTFLTPGSFDFATDPQTFDIPAGTTGTMKITPAGGNLYTALFRVPLNVQQRLLESADANVDATISGNLVGRATFAGPAFDPNKFIPAGSVWKYLDDGSNQGTDWKEPAFDDTAWFQGPTELGYNTDNSEPAEAEKLQFGGDPANKHLTYYFRHRFNVDDPAEVGAVLVRLKRDDGAAVYLNGRRLFLENLPDGALYNDPAGPNSTEGDSFLPYAIGIIPGELLSFGNVLAVEMHQRSRDSSDLSFDLELIPRFILTDFDDNNTTNGLDYEIWRAHYGQTVALQSLGDANGDGKVTALDYTLWADRYVPGPGPLSAVPEPSGVVLAGLGLLAAGLVGLRRKR